jgi:peptide/nickel transport system permease protein
MYEYFEGFGGGMMRYIKNIKIVISLLFLVGLVITSLFFNDNGKMISVLTKNGSLMGKAPFSPMQVPPLGTDPLGFQMFNLLLVGAKYTVLIAVLTSFFRVVIGAVLGMGLTLFPKWVQYSVSRLFSPVNYFPLSLLGVILLAGVIFNNSPRGDLRDAFYRAFIELITISLLNLPTLVLYFKDITNQLLSEEHIMASRVIGAGPFAIIRRHIWVGIKGRLMIQFVEQIIQVLLLLVHLGLFDMLLGGSTLIPDPMDPSSILAISRLNEWSGMIGSGYRSFLLAPWLCTDPLIGFTLVIFAFNLLRIGLNEVQNGFEVIQKKPTKNEETVSPVQLEIDTEAFLPMSRIEKEVG